MIAPGYNGDAPVTFPVHLGRLVMTNSDQTAKRIKAGLQCPECYGVRISPRQARFEASPHGWQWSPPIKGIVK